MARAAAVGYHPSKTPDPTTSPGPAPDLSLATLATVHRRLLPWLLVTRAVALVLPGPGAQRDARRLARFAGQPPRLALPLAFLYLWVAVLLVAGGRARAPALSFGVEAACYLLVLPMLLTWAAVGIMDMIRRAGPEAPEAGSGVPRGDGLRPDRPRSSGVDRS